MTMIRSYISPRPTAAALSVYSKIKFVAVNQAASSPNESDTKLNAPPAIGRSTTNSV